MAEENKIYTNLILVEEFCNKKTLSKDELMYCLKVLYNKLMKYSDMKISLDLLEEIMCTHGRRMYGPDNALKFVKDLRIFKSFDSEDKVSLESQEANREYYKKILEKLKEICGGVDEFKLARKLFIDTELLKKDGVYEES